MSKKVVENKTGLPFNQLIDDLKNEDIRKRLNSVQNLHVIANALGPERTRLELIPFLNELMDDEDEILAALVESLSNFLDYIGGNQHAVILFAPMEALCKADESSVRDKAAQSLKKLIQLIDVKKNEEMLINLSKRLNESGYYLTKGPLSAIIPSFYEKSSPQFQSEMNNYYLKFAQDDVPYVRKQASINLKDFVKSGAGKNESVVIQIINTLIKDEQDLVRLYIVDAVVAFVVKDTEKKQYNQLLQFLQTLSADVSWRIKYYFCEKLADISKAIGKSEFKKNFTKIYLGFLDDAEPELRAIAASKLDVAGSNMEQDEIIRDLIPIVKKLSGDPQNYVRTSLSSSFMGLSQFLGKKNTTELILPIFVQLLQDTDSDVRISLFKSLNQITSVLGIESLSQQIVPALTELAQDKNWRIRSSSIEIISFFAKEIGQEFLNDKILKILMEWLSDKVFGVREAAVQCVKVLVQYLGSSWAEKNIMSKILNIVNSPNYLHRETVLFLIIQIAKTLSPEYLSKTIVPLLTTLSKDPVANIRFNVSKAFKAILPFVKEKEQLKTVLNTLCEDSDSDVKFYAKQAIDSM
ncbi:hypothetical protein ABPG72_009278 [Tetrahymena utriculariae]